MNRTVGAAMIAGGDRLPAEVLEAFRERFTEAVELFDPDMRTVEVQLFQPGWARVSHPAGAVTVEAQRFGEDWSIVQVETDVVGCVVARCLFDV